MRTLAYAGTALLLTGALLLDLIAANGTATGSALIASLTMAALALVLVMIRRRLTRSAASRAALVLGAGSLLLTVAVRLADPDRGTWGLLEAATLTLLIGVLARPATGRRDAAALGVLALALVAGPWRLPASEAAAFSLLTALLAGAVLTVGLLRRADDLRTAQALLRVRDDERRRIARDLHDDVAHHVTGIVVAAQAAAVVADNDPAAARTALTAIERTGLAALESMRSLVAVLRDPDNGDPDFHGEAPRSAPAAWPSDLQEMVDRFGRGTGITATLTVPEAGGAPAVAHQQAVQRVAQECLTNIRRHAVGATRADVVISLDAAGLRVTVTDDGDGASDAAAPAAGPLARSGGGFGLVGLQERATALGGQATAGPQAPRGWRVDVTFPPRAAGHGLGGRP